MFLQRDELQTYLQKRKSLRMDDTMDVNVGITVYSTDDRQQCRLVAHSKLTK